LSYEKPSLSENKKPKANPLPTQVSLRQLQRDLVVFCHSGVFRDDFASEIMIPQNLDNGKTIFVTISISLKLPADKDCVVNLRPRLCGGLT
jgi:hypothetical protein